MKEFKNINNNELVDINGGVIDPVTVFEIVSVIVGAGVALYEYGKYKAAAAGKRDAYIAISQS